VIVRPAAEGPFREGGKLGEGAQQSGRPGASNQEGGLHDGASE
jgi:hypothetical protein